MATSLLCALLICPLLLRLVCGDEENTVSEKFLLAESKEQGLLQKRKEKTRVGMAVIHASLRE